MDLTFWELTTPDVWECVDEMNTWANINNQKLEVVICSLAIQKKSLERAHQFLTNVEIKFCENLQEAYEWLESQSMKKIERVLRSLLGESERKWDNIN